MATSNTGIAALPETMSEDDPWAWADWAAQRDPGTYGWKDAGSLTDTPGTWQDMLEAAGIWDPNYVSGFMANQTFGDSGDGGAPAQPNNLVASDYNPYEGYRVVQGRGPGHLKPLQLLDKDGKVVARKMEEWSPSFHEDTYRSMGSVLAMALGGYAAPYLSAAMGGGAMGAIGAGATIGAGAGQIATGNTEGTVKGGVLGGIGGYAGNALNGAGTVDPYGPGSGWGQDTLTNMGYSPAEIAAIQSGAATVGDAGGISWGGTSNPNGIGSLTDGFDPYAFDAGYNTGDINYGGDPINTQPGSPVQSGLNGDPVSDYITKGGASDMSAATPGEGGYPEATYGGVEQLGQYNGAPPITPNFPEQSVPVTSTKIPPTPTLNPSTGIGALVPNLPTGQNPPAQNIKVPDVPEYKMPDQVAPKNDLEKFWDWAKANPKLAMQLFGLGASAFGGKNNGGSGAGGPGTGPQAGMTSTPAAPLNRHYVAPPAGYRPGFDPEWQYFQPGPASAGTSTTQPVQGKVGIASVSNTPTFTSGSSIGSPSVNKPYTPGPNNNMDMSGKPLAPTQVPTFSTGPAPAPQQPAGPAFSGIQGSGGGAPAATHYTWGGTGERQLAQVGGKDALPTGAKNYDDAVSQGWYKARDAADGQYVWTQAGQMKPYTPK